VKRLLLAVLLLSACGKREAETPAPAAPPTRLGALLKGLSASEACGEAIALEWSPSLPVPAEGGRAFKVFFYSAELDETKTLLVSRPAGEAAFDLDGRVSSCRRRLPPPDRRVGPALGPALRGLSLDAVEARQELRLARLEKAAAAYARRGKLGSEAASLEAEFFALAEPPLVENYRALNPDFWAWLAGPAR
jgi:hypothetical protein